MGKKDKKKKGLGSEKTAAKTEKNLSKKLKKQLNKKGEVNMGIGAFWCFMGLPCGF